LSYTFPEALFDRPELRVVGSWIWKFLDPSSAKWRLQVLLRDGLREYGVLEHQ
jgi:hypothetical protein